MDFTLQTGSVCIGSGMMSYDMGAKFYNDILSSPEYFSFESNSESEEVLLRWLNSDLTINGNPIDTMSCVRIWRNDELIAEISTSNFSDTLEYNDQIENSDYYRYKICQVDITNQLGQMLFSIEEWMGGAMEGIIIVELDTTPITGLAIKTCLQDLGYNKSVYIAQNVASYPLESTVDAVIVCLGIFANNHVLSDGEGQVLKDYLDQGGKLYMEGGDTWYYDPQTVVHSMFNIMPTGDGSGDLGIILGQTGTFTQGMSFYYSGENGWIDHIDPISPAFTIFANQSPSYNCGVAYDAGIYKTIGASFEFGGLNDGTSPSTKLELLTEIINFFDIPVVPVELVSFTANVTEGNVLLNWITATEINNMGFEIERSINNTNFVKIGFVNGKGTTTELSNYNFIDNSINKNGNYFYRLNQIDFDGTSTYSNTVEVEFVEMPTVYSLSQNYPNPFNPSTKIEYQIVEKGLVNLTVYDMLGRQVKVLVNEEKENGKFNVTWSSDNEKGERVSSGVYFYRIETGSFVAIKKMMIIK